MTAIVGIGIGGIPHSFDVECADIETGKLTNYRFVCMWDPTRDGCLEAVARSAAAQLTVESRRKHISQGSPILRDIDTSDSLVLQ